MSRTARTARITRTPRTRRLAAAVAVALAVTGGALTAPAVAAAPTAVTAPADAQPPVPLIKDGGNLASAGPSGFLSVHYTEDTASSLWTRYADGSTLTLPGTGTYLPTRRSDLLTQVDSGVLTIRDMGSDGEPVVIDLGHVAPGYQTGQAVGPSSAVAVWTDPEGGEELHLVTRTATGLRAEKITGFPELANITAVVTDSPGTVLVYYSDPAKPTAAYHHTVVDVERRAVVEDVAPPYAISGLAVSPTHLAWVEMTTDTTATVLVMPRGKTPADALRIPLRGTSNLRVGLLDGWVLYGQDGAHEAYRPNPLYALTARSLTDGRTVKVLDSFTAMTPGPGDALLAQGGTLARGEGVYRIGPGPEGVPEATQVATTGRPTALTLLGHDVPDLVDLDRQTQVPLSWRLSATNAAVKVKLTHTATGQSVTWSPTYEGGGVYRTLWNGRFGSSVGSPAYAPVPNGAYTWQLTAEPSSGVGPVLEKSGGFTVRRAPVPHDYDDNGVPDLVQQAGGQLWAHHPVDPLDGRRTSESAPMVLGSGGWDAYDRIVATGNLAGAPKSDLLARDRSGVLWLYQGTGTGFTKRVQVGGGWQAYDRITSAADLTGDGRTDLLAADKAGVLWLYKGTGSASAPFAKRTKVGGGWQGYNDLAAVGNVAGAAAGDLVARDKDGVLWLYLGKGDGTFTTRTRIGGGWQGYHHVTGFGDVNRDGHADLFSVSKYHEPYVYLGTGQRATPFSPRQPFRSYSEPTSLYLY
ncbi:FG-GAP repeat domain-containing protein [Streptomyces sp. NPDC014656]|uniref:FG-GAP repeat domain-containing protein n=1 Tax=Streptomyces sp. NPDC014656 TaxID=3364878 RepID=UPI0036FC0C3D